MQNHAFVLFSKPGRFFRRSLASAWIVFAGQGARLDHRHDSAPLVGLADAPIALLRKRHAGIEASPFEVIYGSRHDGHGRAVRRCLCDALIEDLLGGFAKGHHAAPIVLNTAERVLCGRSRKQRFQWSNSRACNGTNARTFNGMPLLLSRRE